VRRQMIRPLEAARLHQARMRDDLLRGPRGSTFRRTRCDHAARKQQGDLKRM
jgi:hypothetical protein